nr:beta-fructofuranosidase, soluble isoenzyme I-like [Tanacetum cinerariifolium]
MASSSSTTSLIVHNDLENKQEQLVRFTPSHSRVSITKVLFRVLVSVLVICGPVVAVHTHLHLPTETADNISNGDEPSFDEFLTSPLLDDALKRVLVKLETNANVEWQRSAYHFQPDKNFISGSKSQNHQYHASEYAANMKR